MELTCPSCMHVVEVEPGKSAKCRNCGDRVTAPKPGKPVGAGGGDDAGDGSETGSAVAPSVHPQASTEGPRLSDTHPLPVSPESLSGVPQAKPVVRPASVVSFVFGVLLFIPFVTQVVSLCAGAIAVLRPRRGDERVTLAWIGIAISLIVLPCWFFFGRSVLVALRSRAPFAMPAYAPFEDESLRAMGELAETMRRIHRASSAYHRDFGQWPTEIEDLAGRSLPREFTMSRELTFRPPPESGRQSFQWVLIVSDDTLYDLEGGRLNEPHRLVCRLGGKVELLPSDEVQVLLDTQ